MADRYLIDTSIWIDLYENRKGFHGELLGDYALKLLSRILSDKDIIIITDFLIDELEMKLSLPEIRGMLKPFETLIEKRLANALQDTEAQKIAMLRNIPEGDALHAVMARDSNSILISRDRHFRQLEDIAPHYKP